jgi:hypothetical protein
MEAKVIMLQKRKYDNINIILNTTSNELFEHEEKIPYHSNRAKYLLPQHLYLIDPNAEIKESDWYIDDSNQIRQSVTSDKEYWKVRQGYVKIIAATDPSIRSLFEGQEVLEEPYPLSEKSIKLLLDYYNKNGKMPDKVIINNVKIWKDVETASIPQREPDTIKIQLNYRGEVNFKINKI